MVIKLDLTEVKKDEVMGRASDSVSEKSREGAGLDAFKGRMLYSDEELEGHLRERYESERKRINVKDTDITCYRLPEERGTL